MQPAESNGDLPPLVRRPDDALIPALVLPAPLEYVPSVLPVHPRPPHPGFWFSCLWCFIFLLLLNGIGLAVAVVSLVADLLIAQARNQPISPEILGNAQRLQQSPLMAHALAWGMGVAEVASVIFAWLVVRLVVGREWKRQLGFVRPRLTHLVLVLLAAPAMMIIGDLVHSSAGQAFRALGVPSFKDLGFGGIEETMSMVSQWPWWFSVLVIGLGPGVGEELWCRGFLGRGLVGRYGFLGGAILTSFFFGLLHLDPPHVVAACTMGFLLHYVYLTTRCLWLPMLLHFLNNSGAAVLGNDKLQNQLPAFKKVNDYQPDLALYVVVFFLLALIVWALYITRTRLTAADGAPVWEPPYPGAAAPPEDSGTVETIPRFAWLAILPVLLGVGSVIAVVYVQVQA